MFTYRRQHLAQLPQSLRGCEGGRVDQRIPSSKPDVSAVTTYTILPKVFAHLPWLAYELKWHPILAPIWRRSTLCSYNSSSGKAFYSQYKLMFRQKARPPFVFLLATTDSDTHPCCTNDTKDQLRLVAECRIKQLTPNATEILTPATRVFWRNYSVRCNKIQDVWDCTIYEIVQCLDGVGRVYKTRNGAGPEKNINRTYRHWCSVKISGGRSYYNFCIGRHLWVILVCCIL